MIRKVAPAFVLYSLPFALAAIGYWMLFSNLALYDDEGYILLSAREYFAHGGLYESVYSQYGPAFFTLTDAFQRAIGGPVDHTSARLLTLGLWLGTAAACAALVRQQTGSRGLAAFTLTATFLYLYFLPDEPFHPGASILFILALSLYGIGALIRRERWSAAAIVAGAAGAILLLTKINVGIFYLAGAGGWALVHASSDRVRRLAVALVGCLLLLLAVLLMKALGHETWVHLYLALFGTGAFTVVAALRGSAIFKPRQAACFIAAGAVVAAVTLSLVWLRGTSVRGLVEGVLLGPLRHPVSYSYPVDWRPGALPLAGLSLLLALAHPWLHRRFSADVADRVIVALRLTQAAALLAGVALLMHLRVVGAAFTYMAPLIWIWVIPLAGAGMARATHLSRGLLATILLLQYLHAYPVGGSQVGWGTFLFIPLVALGLDEIRQWYVARERMPGSTRRWWPALTVLLVTVPAAKAAWTAVAMHDSYAARSALGLPGAINLHLPETQRTAYSIVALNAAVHADMIFSLPGMFSFNLWTGLPTPTAKNTTLWFTLLNEREQSAIMDAIAQSARPVIIVQESLVTLMQHSKVSIQGVLKDYIYQNFTPAFRVEGFAFLVRKGRTIAPLNVARLLQQPAPERTAPDTWIELCVVSDGTPITTIEVRDWSVPQAPAAILNARNARVRGVAIDSSRRAGSSAVPISWPLQLKGLHQLSVQFNHGGIPLTPLTTVFYLKGPNGEVLAAARIAE
jgi:hypothetical protein